MKENKKVILEQGSLDEYKRVTLEQRTELDQSATPQWDKMIGSTKETTAHYTTIFVQSFLKGLVQSFFFILGFLVLLKLCC